MLDYNITNICKATTPQQCGGPVKTQRKKVISGVCKRDSYAVQILVIAATIAAQQKKKLVVKEKLQV